jgi:hypothetical protein
MAQQRKLAPTYVQLGRLSDARAALAKYQTLAPAMTVSRLRQLLPLKRPESLQKTLEGLRAAGLPE